MMDAHPGFVYLDEVLPDAIMEIRYHSSYNLSASALTATMSPGPC